MKRSLKLAVVTAPVAGLVASVSHAALDVAVTTAVSDATANITEAGGLIIAAAALVFGIRWVKATFF